MADISRQINQNTKLAIIAVLILILGFLGGWLGFLLFGDIAGSCRVLYISDQAIIKAEEERISNYKGSKSSKEKMFFGKTDEAFAIMRKTAKALENRRTKVLFISSSTGSVLGGVAISDLVYKEVIRMLDSEMPQKNAVKESQSR